LKPEFNLSWKLITFVRVEKMLQKEARRSKGIDMHFKQGARLIYLMMGTDGGNMGKRQWRIINFQGLYLFLIIFQLTSALNCGYIYASEIVHVRNLYD
jgi:hypothetical protein